MADVKSTLVSNREATPRVANEPWQDAALKSTGLGVVAVTTSTDSGDKLYFCRISSSAVVREVLLSCTAVSTSGAIDVGLYQTADNGGAVVDADLFASAQVVTTALLNSNIMHESGVTTFDERNSRVWELLGLTEDPFRDYDVVGTLTADMGGTGNISLELRYVDGA